MPETLPTVAEGSAEEQRAQAFLEAHQDAQINMFGEEMTLAEAQQVADVLCPVPAHERTVLDNAKFTMKLLEKSGHTITEEWHDLKSIIMPEESAAEPVARENKQTPETSKSEKFASEGADPSVIEPAHVAVDLHTEDRPKTLPVTPAIVESMLKVEQHNEQVQYQETELPVHDAITNFVAEVAPQPELNTAEHTEVTSVPAVPFEGAVETATDDPEIAFDEAPAVPQRDVLEAIVLPTAPQQAEDEPVALAEFAEVNLHSVEHVLPAVDDEVDPLEAIDFAVPLSEQYPFIEATETLETSLSPVETFVRDSMAEVWQGFIDSAPVEVVAQAVETRSAIIHSASRLTMLLERHEIEPLETDDMEIALIQEKLEEWCIELLTAMDRPTDERAVRILLFSLAPQLIPYFETEVKTMWEEMREDAGGIVGLLADADAALREHLPLHLAGIALRRLAAASV